MTIALQRSELRDLVDQVLAGERLSLDDGLRLFATRDLNALGALANLARQRRVGNRVSYLVNRYLNYSNYCILSCQFCAFARKKRDADGFELTAEQMVEKARQALASGSPNSISSADSTPRCPSTTTPASSAPSRPSIPASS